MGALNGKENKVQMKQFAGLCKNTSIFAIPWMVSLIITYVLFQGISMTTPRYGTRSCLFAALVLVLWTIAFFLHQRKVNKDESVGMYIGCRLIVMIVIAYFIGVFLAYTVWGSGYMTLRPYEMIDNGSQHIDTLFHSSIAESWKRSLYPSTLLNDERYLRYHTFSHFLLGSIAGIMGMPSFIVYNYIYPVLFLPLHCFSALLAVSSAKAYFEGESRVHFIDMIIIGLYIFGVTDNIGSYGVWKSSFFISESFLVANTIAFLSYALTFYVLRKWSDRRRIMAFYCTVIIPVEIFIISWSKISVGLLFTVATMYFVFRKYFRCFKFWILNISYLAEYLMCLRLFNVSGGNLSGTITSAFRWFAFGDSCTGGLGIWGHYLVLSLMTILFIGLEINRNRFQWEDIKAGRTVWVEDIVIVSMLAFLPATIMNIPGGSAGYFSFAIEIPALILLCGHNYIDIEMETRGALKSLVYVVCFSWCIWMGYHHKPADPRTLITDQHNSNLSSILLEIRAKVEKNPENYTIYIDKESFLTQVFPGGRTAIFVCPAMTGVGVINATYVQDGTYYAYTGETVADYGVDGVDNGYLTYEEALTVAEERGKDKLIHMTNLGYEIVNLN